MGVSKATARKLVCLSFVTLLASFSIVRSGLAEPVKPRISYDEKKREANDIAVTVVVSGISCTCARFTEDIRNVVNDLGPDGIRVLPVLGVGGLQNLNDVLFLKKIDMAVVDEDNLRLLKKKDPVLFANIEQRVNTSRSSTIPSFKSSRETTSGPLTICVERRSTSTSRTVRPK